MASAAIISGLGSYLPPRRVSNDELAERFNTSHDWISSRTGIHERRWVDLGTSTGDLASEAAHRALKSAKISATDSVDMVILATTTPDHPCPGTAPHVASRLGLGHAPAFDISAACSGFIYGLSIGSSAIEAGHAERVLVIGADTYSTILNPEDRSTCVVFGDGAGAIVLRRGSVDEPGAVLKFDLGSDGNFKDLITIPAGGSRRPSPSHNTIPGDIYFTMHGKEVFTIAVQRMKESSARLIDSVGWPVDSVNHLVGHQANLRILHAVSEQIGIDKHRAVVNIDRVGNTSAASIPLALADAAEQSRFTVGDRLLLTAFGGGLTWGSAVLTWPDITLT